MNKPKRRRRSIDILGTKVKIKYVKELLCEVEDEPLDGAFCPNTMNIYISENADRNGTILHEAIHGCLEISGTNKLISLKVEEAIVSALESGLKPYFVF